MSLVLLYLIFIQYFVAQVIVASRYINYSFINDYISALGNTIKSPRHAIMNGSFLINAFVLFIGGCGNNYDIYSKGALILSSVGSALVGLNPENKNYQLHQIGAMLSFVFGNVSLFTLGYHAKDNLTRNLCYSGGTVGIIGSLFFFFYNGQKGLSERLLANSQTIVLLTLAILQL